MSGIIEPMETHVTRQTSGLIDFRARACVAAAVAALTSYIVVVDGTSHDIPEGSNPVEHPR